MDGYMSIMLLDDPMHNRKAKPTPFTESLCGERWFKYLFLDFSIYTNTGVAYFDPDIFPWRNIADESLVFIDLHLCHGNGQGPSCLPHGMMGIGAEV